MHEYQGYVESAAETIRRREVPSPVVALILNLGPPFRMIDPATGLLLAEQRSFVAGLHDRYAVVDSTGAADCLQVDFAPLGAYRFFGAPMHQLAHTTTAFGDIVGSAAEHLLSRLYEAPTWAERFSLLDVCIAERMAQARALPEAVVWAYRQLEGSHGAMSVSGLAAEIGWSRKRLLRGFREHVGLPAKTLARVFRFHCAMEMFEGAERVRLSDVAAYSGYADQSHMSREFRELAGWSPRELAQLDLAAGEGIVEL